jgi:ribosomal protein S14
MISFNTLNKQRMVRLLFFKNEKFRACIKLMQDLKFYPSLFLHVLYLNSKAGKSMVSQLNSCIFTKKTKSVTAEFKISRFILRRKLINGMLSGINRST